MGLGLRVMDRKESNQRKNWVTQIVGLGLYMESVDNKIDLEYWQI